MADTMTIPAERRFATGKSYSRSLRRQGRVPAILYGEEIENQLLEVDSKYVEKLVTQESMGRLFDVTIGDESHKILLKEVQRDPVRGDIIHIDFHKVDLDKEIETSVSIVLIGEEEREVDGGIINQNMRELPIACLPTAIPDRLEIDVSGLLLGDSLNVSALDLPEAVRALVEDDTTVVSVVAPRIEEEPEPAEEELEELEEEEADEDEEAEDTEEQESEEEKEA